ncbi:Hypothetical predicted protein [Podarcis lilfordi]|uniref:Uncharacterized protein n=1 Tax=Podarcis lilfordi TaxID=74358 RepID=A0AA35KCL9_9SAUR|nr:Hypothetical predicted protein [Podarcis lilfordi]
MTSQEKKDASCMDHSLHTFSVNQYDPILISTACLLHAKDPASGCTWNNNAAPCVKATAKTGCGKLT